MSGGFVRVSVSVSVVVVALSACAGTKFDCCRDGNIATCECPANSDCIAQIFDDCGDGTCVDGDDDGCDDGE